MQEPSSCQVLLRNKGNGSKGGEVAGAVPPEITRNMQIHFVFHLKNVKCIKLHKMHKITVHTAFEDFS